MKSAPLIRFRIDFAENANLGPGKIALLEEIKRCGSLSEAARAERALDRAGFRDPSVQRREIGFANPRARAPNSARSLRRHGSLRV
jgi:hypothetical protein